MLQTIGEGSSYEYMCKQQSMKEAATSMNLTQKQKTVEIIPENLKNIELFIPSYISWNMYNSTPLLRRWI